MIPSQGCHIERRIRVANCATFVLKLLAAKKWALTSRGTFWASDLQPPWKLEHWTKRIWATFHMLLGFFVEKVWQPCSTRAVGRDAVQLFWCQTPQVRIVVPAGPEAWKRLPASRKTFAILILF